MVGVPPSVVAGSVTVAVPVRHTMIVPPVVLIVITMSLGVLRSDSTDWTRYILLRFESSGTVTVVRVTSRLSESVLSSQRAVKSRHVN
eukprot:COSAG06_NODE_946_length_11363_cov_6.766602_3_plen_88_part_00